LLNTSADAPTGSVLATSDKLDISLLPTSGAWVRFVFRSSISLTAGTTYAVALTADNTQDDTNQAQWRANSAGGYAAGSVYFYNGTTWSSSGGASDTNFKIYVTENDNTPAPPSGYNTSYAQIGWVYNNSSSNFEKFEQQDHGVQLTGANYVAPISATILTLQDLSAIVPPTSVTAEVSVESGVSGDAAGISSNGLNNEGYAWMGGANLRTPAGQYPLDFQHIYHRRASGTGSIYLYIQRYTWSTSNIGTPSGAAGGQIWLLNDTNEAYYSTANVGIGVGDPTAVLHLKAGTTAANSAPLKFNSGSLLTTAEAGAIEFLTDAYYGTITTGAARKTFAFLESPSFTTPNIGAASGSTLTLSDDIIFSADKVIRRNTSDGSDSGWLTLAGGGGGGGSGQDNSRGGWINILGAESTATFGFSGVDIGIGASAGTAKMLVRRTDGTNSFEILGSDGSATFASSAQSAWMFNSTRTGGGYINVQEGGSVRLQIGNAESVPNISGQVGSTDGAVRAGNGHLWLEADSGFKIKSERIAADTTANTANMYIDPTNFQLHRSTASSQRYKQNIETFDDWQSTLLPLRPVTFNYLPSHLAVGYDKTFYGLIAEEVAETFGPDTTLAVFDNEGRPENVNYPFFISPLIRAVQELNLNLETLAGLSTPLPGSASESFVSSFFSNLFTKITTWLADATNGIGDFFANRIRTKEICVSDEGGAETCVDKNRLDALLIGSGSSSSTSSSSSGQPSSSEEQTVTEEITTPSGTPPEAVAPAAEETVTEEPTIEETASAEETPTPEPEPTP